MTAVSTNFQAAKDICERCSMALHHASVSHPEPAREVLSHAARITHVAAELVQKKNGDVAVYLLRPLFDVFGKILEWRFAPSDILSKANFARGRKYLMNYVKDVSGELVSVEINRRLMVHFGNLNDMAHLQPIHIGIMLGQHAGNPAVIGATWNDLMVAVLQVVAGAKGFEELYPSAVRDELQAAFDDTVGWIDACTA